jgi:septal ring factor EnvC (AmiA/AmiB activator)
LTSRHTHIYRTLALLSALACFAAAPAYAQNADDLKAVEKDLKQSQAEKDRLQKEGERLTRDLRNAQQDRISLAKDIQDQEYSILLLENRIADLEAEVAKRSTVLARRDKQMGHALMALERLALHPGDSLTLSPLAPDDAVRAAILLRAAVPAISASSQSLQKELADLYRQRSEIVTQKEQVAAEAAALADKRLKLEAMIETKTERQTSVAARSADVAARVTDLAQQAEDLRALFAKLAEEKAKRQEAALAARKAEAEKRAAAIREAKEKADSEIVTVARPAVPAPPHADDDAAGRPFSKARGTLPLPAVGKIAARYGQTSPGGTTKGITIATRPGATVVAPYDGVVAFAGPFRGYGKLIIIEHSEGYHTLIAGMARIDTSVGQRVLAGEPIAAMAGEGGPTLYVELRKDGQPINPMPWLSPRSTAEASR